MTTCGSNPIVSFLRTYGPSPQADNLSDENVRDALDRFGVRPIEIPALKLGDMTAALCCENPANVILTGTAGDGKTFHIRQFLLGTLGLPASEWPGSGPVVETELPSGAPLRVIRDLSELEEEDKERELAAIAACLRGDDRSTRYLIAANDGQLLRYFRSENGRHSDIYGELARMLRSEETVGSLDLELLNLSRSWSGGTVDAILDRILEHPDWDEGCDGCPGLIDTNPCPIRLNRELLRGTEADGRVFRRQLKNVLRLGAANDSHVPIRYLIMLNVNILLGDRSRPDDPLLDCGTARQRAAKGQYELCNPYENALGLNVPPTRRLTNPVFSQLASLGLGDETNNLLDGALTRGEPADVAAEVFGIDPVFGTRLFEPARHAYYVSANPAMSDSFRRAIATQRRRAFFRLADSRDGLASPWQLSVLHHAGLYLRVLDALEGGRDKQLLDAVARRLVNGLNRALSGMMVDETERLWLAGTIGRTDETVGRVAIVDPIARATRAESIALELGTGARRPRLRVRSRAIDGEVEPLDLRPLLFEYLLRVDGGGLPSSFSRQCQQEIRQFALIAAAAFGDTGEGEALTSVHVLSVGARGEIQSKTLEV